MAQTVVARVKNSSPVTTMKASSKDIKSKKPKHGQLKRGADTKLLEEKCLLVVPHKERLGNMTITEHIVSQDKTQGLSQDETQGLSQRQLACNDLSKYASGISPLPPDNDSHSMGNKYLRFLEKSRKSAVMDSYKKFVITMGLNEQNSQKMSGIYNFRYLKLGKPIYNSIHTGKIRLTEGQEEKTDPMHKVKNSDLLFRFHNTASNGNLESAKLEQHCFEDKCGKEDNGTKGWFWWIGTGWVDLWQWTSNLLDEIFPPELLQRTSVSEKAANQNPTSNNESRSPETADNCLNLHSAEKLPAKSPKTED